MKIVSWNVNGIQGLLKKNKDGLSCAVDEKDAMQYFLENEDPDILCLQEIRCSSKFEDSKHFSEYPHRTFHYAKKRGYAGTALLSKVKPLNVYKDFDWAPEAAKALNHARIVDEGRLITYEFETWFCVCAYFPYTGERVNGKFQTMGRKLKWRTQRWDVYVRSYLNNLRALGKHVVLAGDLNVTVSELDISMKRTPPNQKAERDSFAHFIKDGYRDVFREQHPALRAYSWPSKAIKSYRKYRLDYIITSPDVKCSQTEILQYEGSDHLPVSATLECLEMPPA